MTDKLPPRMMYYDLTIWNKIEKTEDTQELFALVNTFCKEHELHVLSYNVRESQRPEPEDKE